MNFSLTGIVYFFGFITISLLVNRFYQYWQKEKSLVSKNFFIFLLIFDWFFFVVAVGGLFFAKNPLLLKWVVVLSAFLQTLAGAVFGYLLFYLKFSKISPWFGFLGLVILGGPGIFLTSQSVFLPIFEPPFSINWNIPPYIGFFRYVVFLIPMLPYAIFCFNQARLAQGESRVRSLSVGSLLIFALLIAPLDFFLNKSLGLGALGSDIAIGLISLGFLIVVIIIPKPTAFVYVKKI